MPRLQNLSDCRQQGPMTPRAQSCFTPVEYLQGWLHIEAPHSLYPKAGSSDPHFRVQFECGITASVFTCDTGYEGALLCS